MSNYLDNKEIKKIQLEQSWLSLSDDDIVNVPLSPLESNISEFLKEPHIFLLRLMKNPENFYLTCKHIFNVEVLPMHLEVLKSMFNHKYPMLIASRGFGKTYYMALYAMIKAFFQQGSKIVIVGAGFRQAKYVFSYCETIWNNAPILRSLIGNDNKNGPKKDTDRWEIRMGKSTITALPLGHDGTKIRGERATCILIDEYASINHEVCKTVIDGFAAVRANPIQNVKHMARIQMLKDMGQWTEEDEEREKASNYGNQVIIAGTAFYQNNHFYREWQRYKNIILSKGDVNKLQNLGVDDFERFNWKDYCVIRIPFELIPKGFMDDVNITRSKLTMETGIYNMEYGACFNKDSSGFFTRALIDGCTSPVKLVDETVSFSPTLHGSTDFKYVFAIDAASEKDNFSIVVLEVRPNHRRVVYCWTTNKTSFRDRMEKGLTTHTDFYSYCARKIRDLSKVFPTEHIAYDTQGGGYSIEEALHDKSKLEEGEDLWWPCIDENKAKPTDDYPGLHILYPIQFADADWTVEANHSLKKDMSDKKLIFPLVDSISYVLAEEDDAEKGRLYDTLEDCVWEIEEMKTELTTIIHTRTETGRDKWSTPEYKTNSGRKGRLKKDRYSSLLMANMLARQFLVTVNFNKELSSGGGFARDLANKRNDGKLFLSAPSWWHQVDYSQFNAR